ncbi:hypothetical protein DRO50_04030 [Candidatus Bathyarchaeota archaeon]|nr:MAG: hypothetical protein DRO50_04030 [Candidatus Bathyarchaeota archaeon]
MSKVLGLIILACATIVVGGLTAILVWGWVCYYVHPWLGLPAAIGYALLLVLILDKVFNIKELRREIEETAEEQSPWSASRTRLEIVELLREPKQEEEKKEKQSG